MLDPGTNLRVLFVQTERYAQATLELHKLKLTARFADAVSSLTAYVTIGAFFILVFLLLNVGTALWIGDLLGKTYYGFFMVAGFDSLIAILILVFRKKWIINPLRNSIAGIAIK